MHDGGRQRLHNHQLVIGAPSRKKECRLATGNRNLRCTGRTSADWSTAHSCMWRFSSDKSKKVAPPGANWMCDEQFAVLAFERL